MDWAGMLVQRVTQISLEDYFQKYILRLIGIDNITFFPSSEMINSLAYLHQRSQDGSLKVADHLLRYPLLSAKPSAEKDRFCMGGAGCFGKPIEFCRMCPALALMKRS